MVFSSFFDSTVKCKSSVSPSTQIRDTARISDKKVKSSQTRSGSEKGRRQKAEGPRGVNCSQGTKLQEHRLTKRLRPTSSSEHVGYKKRKTNEGLKQALSLSSALKKLSAGKRLQEALAMYWNPRNDSARDSHHTCIIVDCCARCGAIEKGEEIIERVKSTGTPISVETKTALLKGYAHAGRIQEGMALFRDMCGSAENDDMPNVRTVNTLLRGCLWAAACVQFSNGIVDTVFGGVESSEEAWALCRNLRNRIQDHRLDSILDLSSYEYSVVLLCQALRCDVAVERINRMKEVFGIKKRGQRFTSDNSSSMESLAICLLSLARAYALIGSLQKSIAAAKGAIDAANEGEHLLKTNASSSKSQKQKRLTQGGKRAWQEASGALSVVHSRRTVSNSIYRTHRLSEARSESEFVIKWCQQYGRRSSSQDLGFYLVSRLLYFSGGGTTQLSTTAEQAVAKETPEDTNIQLLNTLWLSFGLKSALMNCCTNDALIPSVTTMGRLDCNLLLSSIGFQGSSVIDKEGFIDFDRVFVSPHDNIGTSKKKNRPLCIELGAGFGDWIALQAKENPGNDYVAVELRADRVAKTFAKAMLNTSTPLNNLCCIGGDCASLLRTRLRRGSMSKIFVNHPEPPTQTYGSQGVEMSEVIDGSNEPAHMLQSEILRSAVDCLEEENGKLVIVTDNMCYARLVCITLCKVMRSHPGTIKGLDLEKAHPRYRPTEVFPVVGSGTNQNLTLYEGQPSEAIGHTPSRSRDGVSYFDRLWRSGAGTHAESSTRFVIAVVRCRVNGAMNDVSVCEGIERPRAREKRLKRAGKERKQKRRKRKKNPYDKDL